MRHHACAVKAVCCGVWLLRHIEVPYMRHSTDMKYLLCLQTA